jgi:hypothetical protein
MIKIIKEVFLIELVHAMNANSFPYVVGGDFNIIIKNSESNKPRRLNKWSTLFNAIINIKELKKLELSGRKYTWSNNEEILLWQKLDRILVGMEWKSDFPLVIARNFPRIISDHTALIMNVYLDDNKVSGLFRFELCLFLRDDLNSVVSNVWHKSFPGRSSLDMWQNRARGLRKNLNDGILIIIVI